MSARAIIESTGDPRFKPGDVINSSLSGPKVVEDVRVGRESDFTGRHIDHTGDLCYVLRYLGGKRMATVYSVASVDSDHHLKGTEMFDAYEQARNLPT